VVVVFGFKTAALDRLYDKTTINSVSLYQPRKAGWWSGGAAKLLTMADFQLHAIQNRSK